MITPSLDACGAFVSYLETLFALSMNDLHTMINDFHGDMRTGLSGHEGSLKMLPSFVDKPTGREKGAFITLDLGGTHFRILAVQLDGKGGTTVLGTRQTAVPRKVMQGRGEALFDFMAEGMDAFLTKRGFERTRTYDLAFTFSFPVEPTGVSAGMLIKWTKGFTATGVEGKDVVILLKEALRRKGIDCIRVTALANDTVGTLMARSYRDPSCDLGVILGTGTNACYREKCAHIARLEGAPPEGFMIVNMEWGNFDKVRRTCYDRDLDAASVNPGAMPLEKMVSGMYLGEIARRVLVDAVQRDVLFLNAAGALKRFKRKGSLTTPEMSLIEGDDTSDLAGVHDFLKQKGVSGSSIEDRRLLKRLCGWVSGRGAGLAAAATAAVVTWMDPELKHRHTVAVDGSLFEKYTRFSAKMRAVLTDLYGKKADNIAWVHSRDGSGRGAAIIAAVAATASPQGPGHSSKANFP